MKAPLSIIKWLLAFGLNFVVWRVFRQRSHKKTYYLMHVIRLSFKLNQIGDVNKQTGQQVHSTVVSETSIRVSRGREDSRDSRVGTKGISDRSIDEVLVIRGSNCYRIPKHNLLKMKLAHGQLFKM